MYKQLVRTGMLALAAGIVMAAEPTVEAGLRCAQVKDSLQRLVCYDQAFSGAAATSRSAAPAGSPGPAAAPAPIATAPRPAGPVPAIPPVATAAEREFGDDQVKRTEKQRQAESGPTSLTAKVASVKEYRQRMFLLTLDNGQVWQQMDLDSLFEVAVGDTVQIDKGRLGGYRLARTSNGRSGWVRVTRLK